MTLPSSGTITLTQIKSEFNGPTPVNLKDYYRGGSYVPNSSYTSGVPTSGAISLESFYGAANIVPGNSGILTSGSSFTLPSTSGASVNVLVIGGGGGGGGGSTRDQNWSWGIYGGAGGGAGGNAYNTIGVVPGSTITFSIGGAGGAGSPRDGPYGSGGASGSAGGTTIVYYSGVPYAQVSGGSGGLVSQATSSTSAGGTVQGTTILSPQSGSGSPGGNTGGTGGTSYSINTTVGLSIGSILTYGSTGTPGQPNSGSTAGSGANYGGGGGGGGNNEANNDVGVIPGSGAQGCVFIWWGY